MWPSLLLLYGPLAQLSTTLLSSLKPRAAALWPHIKSAAVSPLQLRYHRSSMCDVCGFRIGWLLQKLRLSTLELSFQKNVPFNIYQIKPVNIRKPQKLIFVKSSILTVRSHRAKSNTFSITIYKVANRACRYWTKPIVPCGPLKQFLIGHVFIWVG